MTKKTVLSELLKQDNEKNKELEVVIYKELQDLIPPLTSEELGKLEQSIVTEGCREPILLWEYDGKAVIIDGHNRYNICQKNNIIFQKKIKQFDTLDDVKDWMILNQLGRRNLTEYQKSYLRGLQYNREKNKDTFKGNRYSSGGQNDHHKKTHEKLAEEHNVSAKTIQRDEKFALGLDKLTEGNKELKDKILNKEIKIPQSIIQEASVWEEEKLKDVQKKIETGQLSELLDELKNVDKKIEESKIDREKIMAKIIEYLKTASDKDLEKIMKVVKI